MLKTFINFFYTHSSYSFWYSSARIRKRQLTFVHIFVTSCIHASEKKCFKHIQLTSRIYHTEVSRFTHIRAQPMPNITYMFISKFLFIHFQPITHNLYTLIWQTFYCAHLTSNFHTFEWTTTYSSDNLHQLSTYTFSSNSLLNTLNWKKKKNSFQWQTFFRKHNYRWLRAGYTHSQYWVCIYSKAVLSLCTPAHVTTCMRSCEKQYYTYSPNNSHGTR